MTPEQIIQILDQATQPNIKLNREAYIAIQQALEATAERFKRLDELEAKEKEIADKIE